MGTMNIKAVAHKEIHAAAAKVEMKYSAITKKYMQQRKHTAAKEKQKATVEIRSTEKEKQVIICEVHGCMSGLIC